jgi:hypothetical protein
LDSERLEMNRQRGVTSEVYAEVQRQFEQWRSTQPSRSRLPESLWQWIWPKSMA